MKTPLARLARTRTSLVALAAVAVTMAACTTDTDTPSRDTGTPDDEPAVTGAASQCDPELADAFSAWAEAGFSGSVAISTSGEFDCLAAYGLADEATDTPNTADTVFGIGSISKAFTAAAIVDLAEKGELSLDDRAGDILPDLDGPVADATVDQLLLHTSGLTGTFAEDRQPLERDDALDAIGGLEQTFEPGSDYLYSNAGYTLLALIIDEVTGNYRDHMASEILPLPGGDVAGGFWNGEPAAPDPRAVGYHDDGPAGDQGDFEGPHWALSGNGDLAMTPEHLATWTHALFTGQIISPVAVEVMAASGFDHGDGTSVARGWAMLDASALGEPVYTFSGGGGDSGHEATVVWLPDSERTIAVATNTPDVTAGQLVQTLGPSLVSGEPLPVPEGSTG
ncbi:serine hydrolase domain-containing protein, partial [Phytoactinopolyspora endophytica]|uniref:serine hydrolase domain-containing protein n=1 Tax=Phytoactinopolyspora endophytica TaxID=1642495 RepID=UPI0013EC2F3D